MLLEFLSCLVYQAKGDLGVQSAHIECELSKSFQSGAISLGFLCVPDQEKQNGPAAPAFPQQCKLRRRTQTPKQGNILSRNCSLTVSPFDFTEHLIGVLIVVDSTHQTLRKSRSVRCQKSLLHAFVR